MARRFDFGSSFSRIFTVLGSGFTTWVGVSVVFFLPVLAMASVLMAAGVRLDLFLSSSETDALAAEIEANPLIILLPLFAFVALTQIHVVFTTAALVHGVFKHLRNEGASVGDCVRSALARTPGVLALALLQTLSFVVGIAACCLPVLGAMWLWLAFWYVAVAAYMVEGVSVMEALSRSQYLTRNYRWPVFGVGALLYLIGMISGGAVALFEFVGQIPFVILYITSLIVIPVINAIGPGVVYHDLREAKEGLDEQELEQVFE